MKYLLLTTTLAVLPTFLRAELTDGLVAHYKFDETSGTVAADSVRGAAGNGTLTNFSAAAPWVAGKIGGAVEADGANDWITTATAIANNATAMSFSGWVWADTRPAWASIAKNWGSSSAGQFHLGLDSTSGRLSNYLSNSTNIIDPTVFPLGSWQHVAFTYDGATHRLYRNGAQVGLFTTTTALVRNSATTALGVKTNNGGTAPDTGAPGYWDGKYDDFGFWNRALTAAEVTQIYDAGLGGAGIGGTPAPVITSFTASPANVPSGGTTTLSWTAQYADTLSLNGGSFANQNVTGQTSIVTSPLTGNVTFTLTAISAAGSTSANRLVGVGASVLDPVISEFLAANDTGLRDATIEGDREDWIEIRNPNVLYTLELGGYHLTDEPDNLDKWAFPAVTIPPAGYLVVFASEKNRAVAGAPLHTNFKLAENGEYLALVKPDGATIVQEFSPAYPDQSSDISYSSAGYLATPTPGAANSGLAGPAITAVTQNPPPPLDADNLTINATVAAQGGATVSTVTLIYRVMYGTEVNIPMTLDAGVFSAVIPASASNPGQMIRWRIAASDSAARTSRAPLFRDPTNSPEYFGSFVQDASITTQLPVIHRFVQNEGAINGDPGTRCSIFMSGEFFDNCGIRIRGFTSRSWPKKSHKIEGNSGHRFRFKTGVPRVTEFDLNTTYTDKSYVRSILTSEMQRAIGMASPEIFPVHIRQNGLFYSVAHFTENPDAEFLQRHGIDPDGAYYKAPTNNFYTPGNSSNFEKKSRLYEAGKADLDALITNLSLTGSALETYVFDNMDLPGMVNYIATTCITQNIDASDKNHYAWRDTNGTGEWVMLPWDLDLTFGPNALNVDTIVYNQNYASHPFIGATPYLLSSGKRNRFLEAIINTPRSKDMVIRRIRSLMDQFLAANWFQNRIDQLVPLLNSDVTADRLKWGASSHFGSSPFPSLQTTNNRIKNEYLAPRLTWLNTGGTVGIPASQTAAPQINFGAYDANPASANQDQEYIELINPNAFSVDVSNWTIEGGITHTLKSGTVMLAGSSLYLTPSPAAFRARTTGPGGGQRLFVQNIDGHLSSFGETLTLKNAAGAPIASLTIPPNPSDPQRYLVVSEVMYHPEPDGEAEFVELMNISPSVTLDLAGVKFTAGIDFTFPASVTLAPGARILVVRNAAAFESVHGTGKPVAGEFVALTSLSNGGERIKLDDATGSTIREFTYSDTDPWPAAADGTASLVLIAPLTNPDHSFPQNWRASLTAAGNPGGSDALAYAAWKNTNASGQSDDGDDDGDGLTTFWEFAAGGTPGTNDSNRLPAAGLESVAVGGITDIYQTLTAIIRSRADVQLLPESGSDLTVWTTADLILLRRTLNPDGTETLTWRHARPYRTESRAFLRLRGIIVP